IVWGSGAQTSRALIWTLGAPALTSVALPSANYSSAVAVSADGATFIGNSDAIFGGQHVQHAFRYRADTGVVDLCLGLSPASYHGALAASRDGNIVVGTYNYLPPQRAGLAGVRRCLDLAERARHDAAGELPGHTAGPGPHGPGAPVRDRDLPQRPLD